MGQLHIEGKGSVSACPDTAHINCTVWTKDGRVENALQANNEATAKALELLKETGVDTEKDVQTMVFRAEPVYKHDSSGRRLKGIDYFQVINSFQVKVKDLCSLGKILTGLGEEKNTTVTLGSFTNSKAEELLDEARKKAVACAIKRAELYTQAAGVTLKGIESITESSFNNALAYGGGRMRKLVSSDYCAEIAAAPVCEGEQDHSVSITVVFAIGDECPATAETPSN